MRSMRIVAASAMVVALAAVGLWSARPAGAEEKQTAVTLPQTLLPDLLDIGLKQAWQRQLVLHPGEMVKKAWRVDTSVYVASNQSRLFRIDVNSGVLAFADDLGEANFEIYRPIELRPPEGGPSREVLVVTRGQALVLDKITGDPKRSGSLGISVSTNPVLVGGNLCVGSAGYFDAMFLDRLGTRNWRVPSLGDLFDSTPVVVDNKVIVASRNGLLWRVNPENGSWEWKDRKTNGPISGGLVADGRAVYVSCLDQRLYAFSIDNGAELWQTQLEGLLEQSPALGTGVVMAVSRDRGLYAVTRKHGDRKWFVPGIVSVGTVEEDHVWAGDNAGNLKSIALDTGDVLASAPIADAQIFVRNTDDEKVIVVNHGGGVGEYLPK